MGGWISLIGDVPDFYIRLNKFKKIFSVEGVPCLRTENHKDFKEFKTICWAWNENIIPDVYVKKHHDSLLILCGVITDLGHFCPLPESQDQAAGKMLELWLEYGEEMIERINGSFSLLFYNQKTEQASVFADRFSSRSVWFGNEDGTWIIGNFLSAVAVMRKCGPKLDPAGFWSLLHAGRYLGMHGLYSGIRTLLAGQNAVLSSGNREIINRWWKREYEPETGLSSLDWGHHVADSLVSSANRYKKVTKSPYLFLSGGLDSRIVAAAFKQPLKTLSLCTNPNAETRIASMVSQSIGLKHKIIARSNYWYLNTTNVSALISSGIYLNHHTHFIVPVQIYASKDTEAEFLLGDLQENFNKHYFSTPTKHKLNFNPDNVVNNLYSFVPYTIKDVGRIGKHINKELRKSIEKRYLGALKEFARSVMDVSENHADRFDTFLRWADVGITPTYNMITCIWPLAKERNICFDNELNDLSLKIPADIRGSGALHKWILYSLHKMLILIPDANTFMPPFFPNKLCNLAEKIRPFIGKLRRSLINQQPNKPILKTSGSWPFLHEMYRKDKLYRNHVETIIFDKNVFPSELFDEDQIKKTWEEYLAGNTQLYFEIEALRTFGNLNKLISYNGIDI